MAIIIFRFFTCAGSRKPLASSGWLAPVATAFFLLSSLPSLRAGLLPFTKDRAQADVMYQQANTAYQSGDYPGAHHLLDQAEQIKPDQADGWNLRGVIYLKQKVYDKAEAAFARSVAIDPTLWAAQFNLAEAPFQKKDFARARTLFDRLLAQTDRFKETNKWELVLYKGFLCALLVGDEADARKKLAKLPPAGGKTPASLYAQAALLFSHKDAEGARKILATAQSGHPSALNDLFSSSLEVAGWQSPSSFPPGTAVATTNLDPTSAAAMNAAGITNPNGVYSPTALPGPRGGPERPAVVIDPKLEASVAEPLPSSPGSDVRPVASQGKATPAGKTSASSARPSPSASPVPSPAAAPRPLSTPRPDSPLDHGGLMLGVD